MRSLLRHPARAALAGAIAIAFSAILYRTAHVSPETGAFFRCAYALPALWLVVRAEERLLGPRPRSLRPARGCACGRTGAGLKPPKTRAGG